MECRGAFTAQQRALFAIDPNTIFQFFVFEDRLVLVKVGSAANQVPQVFSAGLITGPVGVKDHARDRLPSLQEARQLMRKAAEVKSFALAGGVKGREIPFAAIETASVRKKLLGRGLELRLREGKSLFFQFLAPDQEPRARELLKESLGPKWAE